MLILQKTDTNLATSSNHDKHLNPKKTMPSEPPTHIDTRLAIPAHEDGKEHEGQWKARSIDMEGAATSPETQDDLLFTVGAQLHK
jgi:hypothetical protein